MGPIALLLINVLKHVKLTPCRVPVHNVKMNRTLLSVLVIAGVVVFAAWHFFKSPDTPTGSPDVSASSRANAGASSSTITGSAMVVTKPTQVVPKAAAPVKNVAAPPRSELAIEFEKSKHLKVFYERYMANPDAASPELKYYAAVAVEDCMRRSRSQPSTDADRMRFQNRLKYNDPNNDQRVEAFNRMNGLCEGFQNLKIPAADVSRLYAEAAAAGNPAAQVAVAAEQFRDEARNARGIEERRLSEDQLALLRSALATGDPFAIQRAGQLLTFRSTQLTDRRLGPNNDPVNAHDLGAAWTLSACDHGANCGPDAYRMLSGCAYQGACGYQSLEAYMEFNELAPNTYVNAQQLRSLINDAIAQGRWDWLGIAQGMGRTVTLTSPTTGNRTRARGGPAPKPGG